MREQETNLLEGMDIKGNQRRAQRIKSDRKKGQKKK